jgi:ribonucleotide reductase alpha subunit
MLDNSTSQDKQATPVAVHSRSQSSLPIERRFSLHVTEYEQRDVVVDFKSRTTVDCRVPKAWSDNAVDILMSKYAVRAGVPDHLGGVNGREVDAERIFDRLVAGWRAAAIEHGYWSADDPNLATFCAEIKAMLEQQRAAPNSPQWFNTGVQVMYGIQAGSDGHYYAIVDAQGTVTGHACPDSLAHPQISACFIQSVDDKLVGEGGIMDLWTREARLFKYGSGSGSNVSRIRGKHEKLSRGGMSSGLLSFLRVGDRSAGAIKSAGTTRRAAKMLIVDDDHPDIEEFIGWKTREDAKIRALHAAGIGDPRSFEDEATETVSGQNANNSVSVSDAFMRAVEDDGSWTLTRRTDGAVHKTLPARGLWQQITEAAWACADPGLQFRDTINEWHTCKADGSIRGSNPCSLSADTLIPTEHGYARIDALAAAFDRGEPLPRVLCFENGTQLRQCLRAWKSGDAKVLCRVETANGQRLVSTLEHRFLLASGEYVEAQQLLAGAVLRGLYGLHVVTAVTVFAPDNNGDAPVYDIEVEGVPNFGVTWKATVPPVVVHNSEYVFLDDTACNLASINLAKFHAALYPEQRHFDWDGYAHACRLWTIVLDISVSMAGYPTAEIARRSMLYRTLGLGYAALGELLVMLGLGYGTHAGQDRAAELASLMTAVAYMTSTEIAEKLGAFPRFNANREHVLTVLGKHRNAAGETTRALWNVVITRAQRFGVRNAQVTLLAPTGTIGIQQDCETLGVEPFFSDTIIKQLAGGGYMKLVSKRFAETLVKHGHDVNACTRNVFTVEDGEVREYTWIEPPTDLTDVLVCADSLAPEQHVAMMAAIQPHLSMAISKTVNMPHSATVEDVASMYSLAWRSGLKSIAIYRDGCKPAQPMQGRKPKPGVQTYATREAATEALQASTFARSTPFPFDYGVAIRDHEDGRVTLTYNGKSIETDKNAGAIADALGQFVASGSTPLARGQRVDLPETLDVGVRVRVSLSGHTFHLLLTEYPDGSLAEIFVTASRTGSAIAGWVNAWAKTASLALQHGTPLTALVDAWRGEQFEPAGFHDGRPVLSPIDAFARIIEARYLSEPALARPVQPATPPRSGNVQPTSKLTVCKRCGSTTGCS